MGRYLTPSKVTLLVLAHVYIEGLIPLCETTRVLSFLVKHILPDLGKTALHLACFSGTLSISQFETEFSDRASNIPGRSIWDLLLKELWAIDCLAALDVFISESTHLLAKSRDQLLHERDSDEASEQTTSDLPAGRILISSPLGAFMRRCYLENTRLRFQDSGALWQDLISYRSETRAAYEQKNGVDGLSTIDVNLSNLGIDDSHPLVGIVFDRLNQPTRKGRLGYSTQDVEKLFEFQIAEMQRLGGRLPQDMHLKLREMSKKGATLPRLAYYLNFLDSWHAGDYPSAFDNLHRYFDHAMQSRDRILYQYALLNLAVLQADFGCYSEAIPAIQEAIATARENRDLICLNFCMSWLYHLGRCYPAKTMQLRENGILGSEIEGLAFLKSRARDAEMWSLLSTSLLTEARLGLQYGDSLALVFENIARASHINGFNAAQNAPGPSLLIKQAAYARIGQSHMGKICGDVFLQCYGKEGPIENVLECHCRLAGLLAQRGRYEESEAMMASVPEPILKVLKFQNHWQYYSNMLKLRRFLHRNDLDTAGQTLQRLKAQRSADLEMHFLLGFLEVELNTRNGDLEQALRNIEKLAEKAQTEYNDVMVRTKLMLLKAGLWAKSGHPMKGFSLVMRAVNSSYNARLLPALWEAVCGLANILHDLQEFAASRNLLEAIMSQVLECQDCELAARTHSLLADSIMGLAGLAEANSTERGEFMLIAMTQINAAFEQYEFIEDLPGQLDMLMKKSKIQRHLGDLVLAHNTAKRYLEIRNKYVALGAE